MNRFVEFHDSLVVHIMPSGDSIVVRFGPAYVHYSEGRAGSDPGSCWVQDLDVVISEGLLKSGFNELPRELDGGSLCVGGEIFENGLPLPFDVRGAVRFSATSMYGEWLDIQGNGVKVVPIGQARYVEHFPGI